MLLEYPYGLYDEVIKYVSSPFIALHPNPIYGYCCSLLIIPVVGISKNLLE